MKKYFGRVSGPLLDRIDIQVEVPAVSYEELSTRPAAPESSAAIRARVNAARAIQGRRFGVSTRCNAHMTNTQLDEHCVLDDAGKKLMESAFTRLGMTARSYTRILKVARTIADLEGTREIQAPHLAEALQYRQLTME